MRMSPDRRRLLKAAGAGALLSRLVDPFTRPARAAAPSRFVFFWHANGAPVPAPPGNTAFMDGIPGIKARTLNFPSHADHKFGMPFSLDGRSGVSPIPGNSIDQEIANKLASPALVITGKAKHQNYRGWVSYKNGSTVLPIESPRLAFESVFGLDPGGGAATTTPPPGPTTPGTPPPAPAPKPVAPTYSAEVEAAIFQTALNDAHRLWQRLPKGAEKQKMDSHIEAINQLAKKLDVNLAPPGTQALTVTSDDCKAKTTLAAMFKEPDGGWDVPARVKKQIDLIAVAFACGRRVATLMVTPGGHDSMDFAFIGVPGADPHNTLAHVDPGGAAMQKIKKWDMDMLSYLITQLKETPDPAGGTLYDSTLILVATETSFGNHSHVGVPVGVTGGLASKVTLGADYRGILDSCLAAV